MPLELKIVSEHAELVGDDSVREYHENGGTIGRSLQNDWILPDPDRYISGRHATIDYKGGIYYLADTSSNGVYVNNEAEPIGKGNPRRLFNGDRLRMGDFVFEVRVDSGESLVMPLDDEPSIARDISQQIVDEVSLKTGVKLLDEEEITGDELFQKALFGGDQAESDATTDPAPHTEIDFEIAPVEEPLPAQQADAPVSVTAEDLFDSFLDGLGISRVELHPSLNRPDMMLTAGQVLREFVIGATKLLASRANLKNAFRLDQTTVLPRRNNPMKLSQSTNDLLKQLLVGSEGEYLGARDSIREVCRDLLNHQNAFLDAMNNAFTEFAERFDPEELKEGFDRTLGSGLLSFTNEKKYWRLYCDLYPIITEKGSGRFPQMFGEEFVRAYERQVAEYLRHDREGTGASARRPEEEHPADAGLMATQKMDAAEAAPADAAVEDDDIVASISATGAIEIDQSFIDELDDSMAREVAADRLKA